MWEGRSVSGKYPLRQFLGGSDHSAVFLTERPGPARAAIKLIAVDPAEAEQEIARIRATVKLSHPNLIKMYEAGRSQIEGDPFLYVVMEYAEEDLSQILPQRALASSEVSDLLPPLLKTLSYLHGRGFVHGRIKPSNVLAVRDELKLSVDQVRAIADSGTVRRRRDVYDAPETAAGIVSPASDVWSVGATLIAAMTQNVGLAEQKSPGSPSLPENIGEPYRGIAKDCLQLDPKRRCSVQQIETRLQPAPGATPTVAPKIPKPASANPHSGSLGRWLIPIAILIVLLFGWLIFRGNSGPKAANETVAVHPEKHEPTLKPAPESKPAPEKPSPGSSAAAPSTPAPKVAAAPESKANIPTKATASGGEVTHQVIPAIPKSASNTITGTIKVSVQVAVDSSGKVTGATLKSAGPSRYFAGKALEAARSWEFAPPQVNGQPAASTWLLQFRFRRTSTEATPEHLNR